MALTAYKGNAEAVTVPKRLWGIVYGKAKSRKTSLAVSWPGPLHIAELDCDEERLKYVLDRHAPGKEVQYDVILPTNQVALTEAELDNIVGRTEIVIRAAKSAGHGTLIVDGGNTLYRLYQIAYTGHDYSAGRPQDLKGAASAGARADFARISQHFDQLLKPMRDNPDLNVVFTTEPKEVWADGKGTGRYEPRGPESWEFSFDIELMTFVTGGEYDESLGRAAAIEGFATINWCSFRDDRMRGKIIKDPTFDKIRSLLE